MDRYITTYETFSLWQITEISSLPSVARFVLEENYKHHKGKVGTDALSSREYDAILMEEEELFSYSKIIVAKNSSEGIVGSIRVTYWKDNPHTLPLVKIFGDDTVQIRDLLESYHHLWHVGRFAVMQGVGGNGNLFKLLMFCAISPMFQYRQGVLLAEADERLLHVMRALRIDARALAAGKEYICSMTIPIMVSQEGLRYFMLRHLGQFSSLRLELGIRNYPFG